MSDIVKRKKRWFLRAELAVLVCILCIWVIMLAGCGCSSDYLSDQRRQAIKCAENWKIQGFNFDPNSTTCSQMFQKVQDIRRAENWRNKGYVLDPNSLTKEEMDIKVKDIDRARYWKKRGHEFDPYKMTRYEMNRQAKELDEIKYWKKAGYYYDPNSQTVFLTARKKTKLSSLASLHNGGSGYRTFGSSYRSLSLPKSYSYQRYGTRLPIAENDSYYGQISETTGRPKTVHVRGYYRKDGTYVRSHYRSPPRK